MTAFKTRVDIANRALQHCGASRIVTLEDDDKGAAEINFCYDKLREAELRSNVWRFSIKKAVLYPINTADIAALNTSTNATPSEALPTLLLVPPLYSATEDYEFGFIVQDSAGDVWVSKQDANIGNTPGNDNTAWDVYFGSLCVQPFDSTIAYYTGDLVYETIANGQTFIYVNRQGGNSTDPSTTTPYSSTTTYSEGQVVQDGAGFLWRSAVNNNLGNMPGVYGAWSSAPTYSVGAYVIGSDKKLYQALVSTTNVNPANGANPGDWLLVGNPGSWPMWNSTSTYAQNAIVVGTDGMLYQSYQGSNVGQQPVGSTFNPNTPASNWWVPLGVAAPWIANFEGSCAALAWLNLVGATTTPVDIDYPVGTGPVWDDTSRNVFMLPSGYLRRAPQDPKAGSTSYLGAPSGLPMNDWEFEGRYIVSRSSVPIILRFVADERVVSRMDAMFCEALSARIGMEVAEPLTQSGSKINTISNMYKKFMDDAKKQNGIEVGPVEPPEDDYITCRI